MYPKTYNCQPTTHTVKRYRKHYLISNLEPLYLVTNFHDDADTTISHDVRVSCQDTICFVEVEWLGRGPLIQYAHLVTNWCMS